MWYIIAHQKCHFRFCLAHQTTSNQHPCFCCGVRGKQQRSSNSFDVEYEASSGSAAAAAAAAAAAGAAAAAAATAAAATMSRRLHPHQTFDVDFDVSFDVDARIHQTRFDVHFDVQTHSCRTSYTALHIKAHQTILMCTPLPDVSPKCRSRILYKVLFLLPPPAP